MYKKLQASVLTLLILVATQGLADDVDTTDAIIGGGVGGAVGGAIGAEVGDRKGAIVGAALGAALGAAIATDESGHAEAPKMEADIDHQTVLHTHHPQGWDCPPGQAKKGRC